MIFVDTSAFFALADRADKHHARAKAVLAELTKTQEELFTHSYVVVETAALMQRRLGWSVANRFLRDMKRFPVVWVDAKLHGLGAQSFLEARARAISLVDFVSFSLMKQRESRRAFAFDDDFPKAGFDIV